MIRASWRGPSGRTLALGRSPDPPRATGGHAPVSPGVRPCDPAAGWMWPAAGLTRDEPEMGNRIDHNERRKSLRALIAWGRSNRDIAAALGLALRTVDHYIRRYGLARLRRQLGMNRMLKNSRLPRLLKKVQMQGGARGAGYPRKWVGGVLVRTSQRRASAPTPQMGLFQQPVKSGSGRPQPSPGRAPRRQCLGCGARVHAGKGRWLCDRCRARRTSGSSGVPDHWLETPGHT
jgi:hypothetical protein